jgi:subtilase family serine protease
MNPANNAAIDSGGWHVRNGGTSMASPTVAGIAALYLEKCGHSTWADFKEALIATSFTDFYTGSVPNNAYGHGKPHALNLLLQANFTPTLSGTPSFCPNGSTDIQVNSPNGISEIQWSDGTLANPNSVSSEGPISAIVYNASGCKATTATLNIVQLDTLPMLPIFQSGNVLATLSFSTYQWTLNGQDIPGATSQTLEIFPPYGVYTCYCVSPDGCITETAPFSFGAGVASTSQEHVSIFPNPSDGMFTIFGFKTIDHIELIDQQGKCVALKEISEGNYSIEHLEKGIYMLFITSNERMFQSKIIRM